MNKHEEIAIIKGVSICYKPYLKPEEAKLYCNLEYTQLNKKLKEFGIFKTASGYYKREDLELMMSGESVKTSTLKNKLRV
jgi:hypothetical protein